MTKEQFNFIESVSKHWFIRVLFEPNVRDFIACQFALESNFGTSRYAKVMHNYSGMKKPFKRLHYGANELNNKTEFQNYASFDFCVFDYIAWFFYTRPRQNCWYDLDAFKIHLENVGYCPEKGYINKINLIYLQLKSYKNGERD